MSGSELFFHHKKIHAKALAQTHLPSTSSTCIEVLNWMDAPAIQVAGHMPPKLLVQEWVFVC
jgi:hypothetical protein